MVFRLDDLEELFAELGLLDPTEGGHGEAVLGRILGLGSVMALLGGTDGEGTIPGETVLVVAFLGMEDEGLLF